MITGIARLSASYVPKHRRRPGGLVGILKQNLDMLFSSGSLIGSTVVTSALGFVYWIVAARMFGPRAVGGASAAVSGLNLLGSIGMFGMGTLLITELGRAARRTAELVSTGLAVAGGAAAVLALAYVCVAPILSPGLLSGGDGLTLAAVLVGGVSVTAVGLVFDQVLVGLLLGRLQMWRNSYFAGAKLILIFGLGMACRGASPDVIAGTWVGGILVSFVLIAPHIRGQRVRLLTWPRPSALSGLGRAAMGHNVLNIATTIPRVGLPLVVASALTPESNATFFVAWMIVGFLYMLPTHLSISLLAISTGDESTLRPKLRFALSVSFALGVPGSALLMVLSGPVLAIFGRSYAHVGQVCLVLLAASYVPAMVKQLYMAIARVTGQMREAAVVATLGAAAELAAAWFGGKNGGIAGVAGWVTVVCALEAVVMAPRLVTALRGRRCPKVGDDVERFVGTCPVRARGVAMVVGGRPSTVA